MFSPIFKRLAPALVGTAMLMVAAPEVRANDTNLVIVISKDHKFEPSEVTAPTGQRIKIVVRNQGTSNSEFESSDFHREKVVLAGQEITLFVGPLDAGTYEFFDDFHPATRGHLTVK